jgi:DNA polymerase-1
VSADWSQIELRILAHVSGDAQLIDAFRTGADVHRRTASQLFDVAPEDVTPEQRGVGKTVNFATIYGQGASALGQILDVPKKDAEGYIARYFETYRGVRAWLDETIERAREDGYVTTLFGRRRYIPELFSHTPMDRQTGFRMAANTPIQGSAADILKKAMLDVSAAFDERGLTSRMVMQVHDELVFEAPEAEVETVCDLVRVKMREVVQLEVPLVVNVGVGNTWADAH